MSAIKFKRPNFRNYPSKTFKYVMGTRLRFIRDKNKFSREELAAEMDDILTAQAIRKWEIGESTPTMMNIKMLSEIYDVSMEYLICAEFIGMTDGQLTKLSLEQIARQPMSINNEYELANRHTEARDG